MDNTRELNFDLETGVWGVLLIWWGIRWMCAFLPNGAGLLGTGLILIGLNAIRSLMGIRPRRFTTILGILSFVFGGLYLANSILYLPFDLPVFEISLIVLGMIILSGSFTKPKIDSVCCS